MTPEDKAEIFEHIKTSMIPASEARIKKFIKNESRKFEVTTTRKTKAILQIEPVIDNKIIELKSLLKEVDKKLNKLASIEERLSTLEFERSNFEINKGAIAEAIVKELS